MSAGLGWKGYTTPPQCPKCGVLVQEHTPEQCARWRIERIQAISAWTDDSLADFYAGKARPKRMIANAAMPGPPNMQASSPEGRARGFFVKELEQRQQCQDALSEPAKILGQALKALVPPPGEYTYTSAGYKKRRTSRTGKEPARSRRQKPRKA